MWQLIALILGAGGSLASPLAERGPTVHVSNGTVVGVTSNGFDNFLGIPYAQPPVNQLRLQPPQPLNVSFGTLHLPTSLDQVTACTQMTLSQLNLTKYTHIPGNEQGPFHEVSANSHFLQGEDCLSLNVQRPTNIAKSTKLPVLFWIYGGGFEIGATQSYDGTRIVNMSVAMNEPIIFVAVNYRLNAFGFLQGKQLAAAGATNLGLRDQRLGLEWVADNIEAFGGDPNRVTIWGESAGSISCFDHLLVNNGDNTYKGKPLFHGAIMNSGTTIPTQSALSAKAQGVYDSLVAAAGCTSTADSEDDKSLACLRSRSYANFTAAMNTLPNFGGPSGNSLAYFRRPDPSSTFYAQYGEEALSSGRYAKVPVIMGNMQDEATVFVPAQVGLIHDTKTLVDYFSTWLTTTSRSLVQGFIDTYPDDPAAGLPANTGEKYQIYPQSKRNAAIQTDFIFAAGRRVALSAMASHVPAWSYLATFSHALPWWGTYHTEDVGVQFGLQGYPVAGTEMDEAYIHFVNSQNPNGYGSTEQVWPKWEKHGRVLANFSETQQGVTKDDFRWASSEYLMKFGPQMRI